MQMRQKRVKYTRLFNKKNEDIFNLETKRDENRSLR